MNAILVDGRHPGGELRRQGNENLVVAAAIRIRVGPRLNSDAEAATFRRH